MIHDGTEAYLIVDDRVQDKRHSHMIEIVKRQYSGNVHGLVKGIGIESRHQRRHGLGYHESSPRFYR